ncbi:MAG TPA: integrase core domain-containing protein, partial [Kofleriaceae bacterium]|nr:integrase core domain-containing protein [Kofleriaceae bacterium]
FTDQFRGVLAAAGVTCLRLPARSPNLNSVAERFVLSIKSECLSKLVPLGESHLLRAVSEYIEHYHLERNHQGVGNRLLTPAEQAARPANGNAPVERRERLGGLLSFYHRRAA